MAKIVSKESPALRPFEGWNQASPVKSNRRPSLTMMILGVVDSMRLSQAFLILFDWMTTRLLELNGPATQATLENLRLYGYRNS
jgi:hypothetical protein